MRCAQPASHLKVGTCVGACWLEVCFFLPSLCAAGSSRQHLLLAATHPLAAAVSAPPSRSLLLLASTGGKVLELGCGTGASARWLAHKGYAVTAVDISGPALQAAAAAAAAEGLSPNNPAWIQRDIFELDGNRAPETEAKQDKTAANTGQGPSAGDAPAAEEGRLGGFDFVYDCQSE